VAGFPLRKPATSRLYNHQIIQIRTQEEGGSMLHDRNGQSVVEYIVVLAIFITLVGGALWEVFSSLQVKFNDVNVEIGS
jgi:hypothetical protein